MNTLGLTTDAQSALVDIFSSSNVRLLIHDRGIPLFTERLPFDTL